MDIPGYYFDKEKNRYFRVETNSTAPQSASWAAKNVKRRKVEDAAAEEARRHAVRAARRIKRTKALNESLEGGFYARECSGSDSDLPSRCFAKGLRNAGVADLYPPEATGYVTPSRPVIPGCIYVGAQTAPLNGACIYSTYLARNEKNRIDQRALANYRLSSLSPPPYIEFEEHGGSYSMVTSIKYHEPSNLMLVSSRYLGTTMVAYSMTLDRDDDPRRPLWTLPTRSPPYFSLHNGMEAYTVAPAPANSPNLCAWGTGKGIILWDSSPEDLRPRFLCPPSAQKERPDLLRDIFAVDYLPGQSRVLRFGGRGGGLVNADMREPTLSWTYLKLPSAITHLNCIGREKGGDCVLVAGLRNCLGIYDLRLSRLRRVKETDNDRVDNPATQTRSGAPPKKSRSRRSQRPDRKHEEVERPVICFEKYRNEAYIDIGFSYDAMTGVVAAAHDDEESGSVGLYSVRTGEQLQLYRGFGSGLDTQSQQQVMPRLNSTPGSVSFSQGPCPTVIRALQFQTFPGDQAPTLFVGAGGLKANLTAFSINADGTED